MLSFFPSACRQPDHAPRALEIVVPTEASILDPRFSTRSLDIKVTRLVHAGLVGLDPDTLEPVPLVATGWKFVDERTLVLHLKKNLTFHSGRPLEPADVCATIAGLADPSLGSPHRAVVRAIGGCSVTGGHEVTIRLAEPRATLLSDLEVPILRRDEILRAPAPDGDLDGLGPYRISRLHPGSVELSPARTGVLPEPGRRVVVRTVRDANARALRLLAGRSDIAPNAVPHTLLPTFSGRDGLEVVSRPGANVTYLLFQNDRPPYDRADVRRAISMAIDREKIVRTLLGSHAQTAGWIFPKGHWANPDGYDPVAFDEDAAREVLRQLPPASLLTSTDRARVTIARAIGQMLEDAGLEVQIIPLDLGVLLQRLDQGDFLMAILQMPELTEPNILKWFFHPSGVPGEGGEGRNRARFRSRRAGELLDRASEERAIELRRSDYASLAGLMRAELPVLPLWHEDQVAVVSRRAKGFRLSAEGRWLAVAAIPGPGR